MSSPDYKAARRALRAYLAAPDRHPPLAYAVQILLRAERTHRKTTIPTLERLYRQEQEQMRLARAENKSLRESISRLREKPPFQPTPADYQALRDANNQQAATIRRQDQQIRNQADQLLALPTPEMLAAEREEACKVRTDLAALREELEAAHARAVSVPALRSLVEKRGREIRSLRAERDRARQRWQEAQEQLRRAQPEKVPKTYADILKDVSELDLTVKKVQEFLAALRSGK